MQGRQTKALAVLDDHDGCVGHVNAHLDHRGRDEHIDLATLKGIDDPVLLPRRHAAMKTLDGGRIGIASQALGIGEGAVEETVKYVQERKQFGKRLSQMQNTQFQLADMHTRMKAAQFLVYSAACKKQAYVEAEMAGKKGESYSADAAMAKLFAAEAASDVTRRAVQLYGGYGYTREYPVERMMRDAKITEIYEGTSEVQMMVISGALLK